MDPPNSKGKKQTNNNPTLSRGFFVCKTHTKLYTQDSETHILVIWECHSGSFPTGFSQQWLFFSLTQPSVISVSLWLLLDLADGGLNFTSGHTEMNPEAFWLWVGSHRFSGLGRHWELGPLSRVSLPLLLSGEDIADECKDAIQVAGEDIGICHQGHLMHG